MSLKCHRQFISYSALFLQKATWIQWGVSSVHQKNRLSIFTMHDPKLFVRIIICSYILFISLCNHIMLMHSLKWADIRGHHTGIIRIVLLCFLLNCVLDCRLIDFEAWTVFLASLDNVRHETVGQATFILNSIVAFLHFAARPMSKTSRMNFSLPTKEVRFLFAWVSLSWRSGVSADWSIVQ